MTVAELLTVLESNGVTLTPRGDKLRVRDPRGAVTPELRLALVKLKPDVMRVLRWAPLVPRGWTPSAWHGRLMHMARICMHADKAEELRNWARAVADRHGLGPEEAE